MIISYGGLQAVKVQFGDTVLAFDMNTIEYNNRQEKKNFKVIGPGEYEIGGIFIKGLPSKGKQGINTIYSVNLENMNICFLGALGDPNLKPETVSQLDGIDVLFIPVGGSGVLSPSEAEKLSVSLEPSIIIPIHYETDTLKKFLKEAGAEDVKPVDKLTLKKKDLEGKEGEIIVLE
ncbi:MAG: MBL fold metallo-hydrolase [Patescibacteria group bacterium]